ncbi:Exosome complex component RRP43 [Gonapodya sp. JEL0774]|nr:Exosome complex component RRP43 [Gonapodya sp. JEL0774]
MSLSTPQSTPDSHQIPPTSSLLPDSDSAAAAFVLDAPTFARLHPAEYLRRFLAQGVRPDGRPYAPKTHSAKFRKTLVNVGSISTAEGSATVRLGKTTVLCGIKAQVAVPLVDVPDEGYFGGSPILDLKQLCIEQGSAVWVLYADVVCLNYDGNVMDAALIAIMAALKDVRLPKATYREEEGAVTVPDWTNRPVSLRINRWPVSTTTCIFENHYFLVDPTETESSLSSATLTVVTDETGTLMGLHKSGGGGLDVAAMRECVEVAVARGGEGVWIIITKGEKPKGSFPSTHHLRLLVPTIGDSPEKNPMLRVHTQLSAKPPASGQASSSSSSSDDKVIPLPPTPPYEPNALRPVQAPGPAFNVDRVNELGTLGVERGAYSGAVEDRTGGTETVGRTTVDAGQTDRPGGDPGRTPSSVARDGGKITDDAATLRFMARVAHEMAAQRAARAASHTPRPPHESPSPPSSSAVPVQAPGAALPLPQPGKPTPDDDEDDTHSHVSWEDEVFEEERGVLSASEAIAELEVIDQRARLELEEMERAHKGVKGSDDVESSEEGYGPTGPHRGDTTARNSTRGLGESESAAIPPSERVLSAVALAGVETPYSEQSRGLGEDGQLPQPRVLSQGPDILSSLEESERKASAVSLLPRGLGTPLSEQSTSLSAVTQTTAPSRPDPQLDLFSPNPTPYLPQPPYSNPPTPFQRPSTVPATMRVTADPSGTGKPPIPATLEIRGHSGFGGSGSNAPAGGFTTAGRGTSATTISFDVPKPPLALGSQIPRHPRLTSFSVSYAAATQQGYRRMNGNIRKPLHDQMEDVHWPCPPSAPGSCILGAGLTNGTANSSGHKPAVRTPAELPAVPSQTHRYGPITHPHSQLPVHIYILADGHGGVQAPRYFVKRLSDTATSLISSKNWEFDMPEQRTEFAEQVRKLFGELDHDYCEAKKHEYRNWRSELATPTDNAAASGSVSPSAFTTIPNPVATPPPQPTQSLSANASNAPPSRRKPVDDGCTLVLNVLYNGYLVNCNVGDSRTVLGRRPTTINSTEHARFHSEWSVCFASVDHSPAHPEKALHIHRNGGLFINDNGTRRHVKIDERRKKPYADLVGARILRPLDDNVKAVGVSHLRTLNLASTMGDLLYKIHPPILSSVPDVSFIRLTPGYDYVLAIGTDGVWDHLRMINSPEGQNRAVVSFVGREWDAWLRQGGMEELMREEQKYAERQRGNCTVGDTNGQQSSLGSASGASVGTDFPDEQPRRSSLDVPSDSESDITVGGLARDDENEPGNGKSSGQSKGSQDLDSIEEEEDSATVDANGLHVHGYGAGKRGLQRVAKMLTDREHTGEMFFPGFVVRVCKLVLFLKFPVDVDLYPMNRSPACG